MGATTANSTSSWAESGTIRRGLSVSQGNPLKHKFHEVPRPNFNGARSAAMMASKPPTAQDRTAVRAQLNGAAQTFWDNELEYDDRDDWMLHIAAHPAWP